jgi:hypothetical protein
VHTLFEGFMACYLILFKILHVFLPIVVWYDRKIMFYYFRSVVDVNDLEIIMYPKQQIFTLFYYILQVKIFFYLVHYFLCALLPSTNKLMFDVN